MEGDPVVMGDAGMRRWPYSTQEARYRRCPYQRVVVDEHYRPLVVHRGQPALTGVHASTPDAGVVAARMLVDRLAGNTGSGEDAEAVRMLASELLIRDSTGPSA